MPQTLLKFVASFFYSTDALSLNYLNINSDIRHVNAEGPKHEYAKYTKINGANCLNNRKSK